MIGIAEKLLECEVRAVMTMKSLSDRRAYFELVEKNRGKEAADKVRAAVQEAWGKRKAGTA